MPVAVRITRLALLAVCAADIIVLQEVIAQQEATLMRLVVEVEDAYTRRCELSTHASCAGQNYDECTTELPSPSCLTEGVSEDECNGCGRTIDYTVSTTRLPTAVAGDIINDDEAREDVCFTRALDPFFIDTNAEHVRSNVFGEFLPQMYFGATSGAFRIYPARYSRTCGSYEPRGRPWYVAASSGPKDVVIILDFSGSMLTNGRIQLALQALEQDRARLLRQHKSTLQLQRARAAGCDHCCAVLDALTIADYFAVLPFSSDASQASRINPEGVLLQATESNRRLMLERTRSLLVHGATNFYAGFEAAFDMLDKSRQLEFSSGCRTAILFLTDGMMTVGTPEQVLSLVASKSASFDATIFTYSLGDGADRALPKQVACSAGGIFAYIPDNGDLRGAMSAYYLLYALGLGDGVNEGRIAWVEPYEYATGGVLGTTASAPVYDRAVEPPHFIGVAAIDMTIEFLEATVGESGSYETVLEELVRRSTALCPVYTADECTLQELRRNTGGDESVCETDATSCDAGNGTEALARGSCSTSFPTKDAWANNDNQGKSYEQSACCASGENGEFGGCNNNDDDNTLMIALIAAGSGLAVVLLVVFCSFKGCCRVVRNSSQRPSAVPPLGSPQMRESATRPEASRQGSVSTSVALGLPVATNVQRVQ